MKNKITFYVQEFLIYCAMEWVLCILQCNVMGSIMFYTVIKYILNIWSIPLYVAHGFDYSCLINYWIFLDMGRNIKCRKCGELFSSGRVPK